MVSCERSENEKGKARKERKKNVSKKKLSDRKERGRPCWFGPKGLELDCHSMKRVRRPDRSKRRRR